MRRPLTSSRTSSTSSRSRNPIVITVSAPISMPPVAIATSRFKRLNNWDRSVIPLPFGRGVIAGAELIWVPPDADNETMQAVRLQLDERLNDVTRRAYGLVGRPDEGFHA